tara:strand:- start:1411 stop:2970 length:1560 start_codon:yes stop_codon:yes gene_type:complete
MKLENYKNYQNIHIWTGILSGLLLYICFVAGAFTMFKAPLNTWALHQEHTLPPIAETQYDTLIKKVLQAHPEASAQLSVYLPNAMPKHAPVQWVIEDEDTHQHTYWQASLDKDGALISRNTSLSEIGDFLDHLHRTAGIPGGDEHDAVGIYVMGIVCVLYFVAIVSGLVIFLPTWVKDLFALRKNKKGKRFWVDFHNILGISALPFHIIIAVTTFVFAYHDILYGGLQTAVYQDKPMFNRPAPIEADRGIENLLSISVLEDKITATEPDFKLTELNFSGLGTPRARLIMGGELVGEIIRGPYYAYWVTDPYTASAGYTAMLPSVSGIPGKVVNSFFTLHFGGFGESFIHWIYFAMGLSGCLLFLSGNIIWIESRRKKMSTSQAVKQPASVRILARLTVGVCAGTFIGIGLSVIAAKQASYSQNDIQFYQHLAYYVGFIFAVVYSFCVTPIRAAIHSLYLLVLLALGCIAISCVYWQTSLSHTIDVGVSIVATCLAVLFAICARRLVKKQPHIPYDGVWQ